MMVLLEAALGASEQRADRRRVELQRGRKLRIAQSRVAEEQESALLRLESTQRHAHTFLLSPPLDAFGRILGALRELAQRPIPAKLALLAFPPTPSTPQRVQRRVARRLPEPAVRRRV